MTDRNSVCSDIQFLFLLNVCCRKPSWTKCVFWTKARLFNTTLPHSFVTVLPTVIFPPLPSTTPASEHSHLLKSWGRNREIWQGQIRPIVIPRSHAGVLNPDIRKFVSVETGCITEIMDFKWKQNNNKTCLWQHPLRSFPALCRK